MYIYVLPQVVVRVAGGFFCFSVWFLEVYCGPGVMYTSSAFHCREVWENRAGSKTRERAMDQGEENTSTSSYVWWKPRLQQYRTPYRTCMYFSGCMPLVGGGVGSQSASLSDRTLMATTGYVDHMLSHNAIIFRIWTTYLVLCTE